MSRARKGTGGHYVEKGTGWHVATLELPKGPDGQRRVKRFRARSERAAFKLRTDFLDAREAAGPPGDGTTFERWGRYWAAEILKREKLNPRTRQQYGRKLELYVYPHIGHLPLDELQPSHLRVMLTKLEAQPSRLGPPLTPSSITIIRTVVFKALKAAVAEGKPVNVIRLMAAVPGPGRLPPRIDDALLPEEVAKIFRTAVGDEIEAVVQLALRTGMRMSEIISLEWRDLRLDQSPPTVTIREGKTENAARTIPIDTEMVGYLDAHLVAQGTPRQGARVFLRSGVLPYVNNTLSYKWVKLSKAALGRTVRFHALRHTAATLMWENGASVEEISKYLGHAGTAITADLYLKARPEKLQSLADGMGELYRNL